MTDFQVCLKDIQRYDAHHDPITLNYMAAGCKYAILVVLMSNLEPIGQRGKTIQRANQNAERINVAIQKRGKTGVNHSRLVLFLLVIGSKSVASFRAIFNRVS